MDINELNRLYTEAESADHELYAEQRSNILLGIGLHYTRKDSKFYRALRENENVSKQVKIRLTKNHLHKVINTWTNSLLMYAPSTFIAPANETEMSDQKAAELHQGVWTHIKKKNKLKKRRREFAKDFYQVGEVACKAFFDPTAGRYIGDDVSITDDGQIISTPKFTGQIIWERILGFNLFIDPSAKSYDEARYVGYRKMIPTRDLLIQYKDDPSKRELINESPDQTYRVFNGKTGTYQETRGLTLVREFYFRPTTEHPRGYYYICVDNAILHEGEIPLGDKYFPIIYEGFDDVPTSPRAFSQIKQLRPLQAEINRCASAIAETQMTLGSDKLILQNGSSISPGGTAHGIKAVKVTGPTPQILAGRDGGQYVDHMNATISELYQIAMVPEDAEAMPNQLDSYAWLFRGLKQKKRFIYYAEKFADFMMSLTESSLLLAKEYLSEQEIIPIVGKKELINIAEFKATDDLCYQIKLEEAEEDVETMMGKQLTLNHILQYAGNALEKADIGKIARAMPFMNKEQVLEDFTLEFDIARNNMLALDRGEMVEINPYINPHYMIQKLAARMSQPDFKYLHPQIQQNYQNVKQTYEQLHSQYLQSEQAANAGYIPSGGALVGCDVYIPKPNDPTKTQRARIPSEALQWLFKRLESQGSSQAMLAQSNPQVINEMVQQGMLGPTPQDTGVVSPGYN